jgi:hypothetical protein
LNHWLFIFLLSLPFYSARSGKTSTIKERFVPPKGYTRVQCAPGSFGEYLQALPVKPEGALVRYYDGREKAANVYDAVVDMEISNKDLQQCADAVMRLRGEYLYKQKMFDKISFNFTNGFVADYKSWMDGKRIKVNGNSVKWVQTKTPSNTYKDFREYMENVFIYAGTMSLSKSMKAKAMKDLSVGDVFIKGGSPGHAVIVVDVAIDKHGNKAFMIAQSYMPAQEIQVLKNLEYPSLSPWYKDDFGSDLNTPEWRFTSDQLKSF